MNDVDVANNLIKDGFSSAKKSMEQILQTPIAIERIEHDDYAIRRLVLDGGEQIHLLKTEIRGELSGACYLLFTTDDVNKIHQACLPEDVQLNQSEGSAMMKIEFLKEIDNMLAAAVITEFADFFDILAYGDVPSLDTLHSSSLQQYLDSEVEQYETIIHSRAIFHAPELSISPHFIWMFQGELLNRIKDLSKN